jgi:hypothetical protein
MLQSFFSSIFVEVFMAKHSADNRGNGSLFRYLFIISLLTSVVVMEIRGLGQQLATLSLGRAAPSREYVQAYR